MSTIGNLCILTFFANLCIARIYVVSPRGQFPTSKDTLGWVHSTNLATTLSGLSNHDTVILCEGEEYVGPFVVNDANITISVYTCSNDQAGIKPVITVSRRFQGTPLTDQNTNAWIYDLSSYMQYFDMSLGVAAVWIKGVRYYPARYPNMVDPAIPLGQSSNEFIFMASRDLTTPINQINSVKPATLAKNLDDGNNYWVGASLRIRELDFGYNTWTVSSVQNGRLILSTSFSNANMLTAPGFFIEHNRIEELDFPGEYYFDSSSNKLYVMPMSGHAPSSEMRFISKDFSRETITGDVIGAALTFLSANGPNNTVRGVAFRYGISGIRAYQNTDLIGIDVRDMTDRGAHGDIRVLGSAFSDIGYVAVDLLAPTGGGTDSTVSASSFRNVGLWAGYTNMPTAVRCYVACRILGSAFDRMGYAAAIPHGDFSLLADNTMSNTMLTLSDGGAVYFGGTNGVVLRNNTVVSVSGNTVSTQLRPRQRKTTAFYLDFCAYNTSIVGNTVLSGYVGPDPGQSCVLFSNGSNTVADNVFVGCKVDIPLQDIVDSISCTAVDIAIDRNVFRPTPNTPGLDMLVEVRFSAGLQGMPSRATFRSISYNAFCKISPNASAAAWSPIFIGLESNGPVRDFGIGNYTNISTNRKDTSGLCVAPVAPPPPGNSVFSGAAHGMSAARFAMIFSLSLNLIRTV